MEKRTSATARIAAALALVVALVVAIAIAVAAMSGDSSERPHRSQHHSQEEDKRPRTEAKTYTVETGDTLTAIAHKTGVPVAEILALNPEVDPQILIAGQTLKLR
jgi:cell envelope opacity-associated protein A